MRMDLRLNGHPATWEIRPDAMLVETLRDAGLTGTKEGCAAGVCGLCTVLVDDRPVSSCLYLTACVADREVWTIEGLAQRCPTVVDRFCEHEAMQCGICTPGQIVALCAARLRGATAPPDLVEYLSGNLCRCTGYQTILAAGEASLADD